MSGPEPSFAVQVIRSDGGVARVVIRGEVDTATAGEVEGVWAGAIGGAGALEADLGGVSFIDSSGLRSLVVGHRLANEAGIGFRVVEANRTVRRLLDITGLTEMLIG